MMLRPFQLGLGGPIGHGRQYTSWIALTDLVRAIGHTVSSDLSGPVNATAPMPVTNAEFTRALGRVVRRPTWARVPTSVIRLALGDMGGELLLSSTRAVPTALLGSGFAFAHVDLEAALRHELGITAP